MQNVVVSVDEDGTVLISIPPGHLPLADMVRAALGHTAPPAEEPKPARATAKTVNRALKSATTHDDATARVVEYLEQNGQSSMAQILEALEPPAPHAFKKRVQAMVKAGTVTATGGTSKRVYGAP